MMDDHEQFMIILNAYAQMLEESTYNEETGIFEAPRSAEDILREKYGPDFENEILKAAYIPNGEAAGDALQKAMDKMHEPEPMAIYVMPWPEDCADCNLCGLDDETDEPVCCGYNGNVHDHVGFGSSRPCWCELKKAIGIIEPGGNARYFGEKGEEE